mmetsp:Transcript_23332/g.66438  ORF Transcript_23332/g.66438 Transcript_23332/m.66438 type:complete len:409 (+) Transcript_23332:101-1327(+)
MPSSRIHSVGPPLQDPSAVNNRPVLGIVLVADILPKHRCAIRDGNAAVAVVFVKVLDPILVVETGTVYGKSCAANGEVVDAPGVVGLVLVDALRPEVGMVMACEDQVHVVLDKQLLEETLEVLGNLVVARIGLTVVHRTVQLDHQPGRARSVHAREVLGEPLVLSGTFTKVVFRAQHDRVETAKVVRVPEKAVAPGGTARHVEPVHGWHPALAARVGAAVEPRGLEVGLARGVVATPRGVVELVVAYANHVRRHSRIGLDHAHPHIPDVRSPAGVAQVAEVVGHARAVRHVLGAEACGRLRGLAVVCAHVAVDQVREVVLWIHLWRGAEDACVAVALAAVRGHAILILLIRRQALHERLAELARVREVPPGGGRCVTHVLRSVRVATGVRPRRALPWGSLRRELHKPP